jgi:hypothetical protein
MPRQKCNPEPSERIIYRSCPGCFTEDQASENVKEYHAGENAAEKSPNEMERV